MIAGDPLRRGASRDLESCQHPGWNGDVAAALSRQPTTWMEQHRPSNAADLENKAPEPNSTQEPNKPAGEEHSKPSLTGEEPKPSATQEPSKPAGEEPEKPSFTKKEPEPSANRSPLASLQGRSPSRALHRSPSLQGRSPSRALHRSPRLQGRSSSRALHRSPASLQRRSLLIATMTLTQTRSRGGKPRTVHGQARMHFT